MCVYTFEFPSSLLARLDCSRPRRASGQLFSTVWLFSRAVSRVILFTARLFGRAVSRRVSGRLYAARLSARFQPFWPTPP